MAKEKFVQVEARHGRRYVRMPMGEKDVSRMFDQSTELLDKGQQASGVDITRYGKTKRYDDVTVEARSTTLEGNNN